MGRTTIEVDDAVRDKLRVYKNSHGMTYDGAITRLLATAGEPIRSDENVGTLRDDSNEIHYSDIITSPDKVGLCSFHENFLSNTTYPVGFGGNGEAHLSWEEFHEALEGLSQYLPNGAESGSFAIHQDGGAWYGDGLGTLFSALENQDDRYDQAAIDDPETVELAVYLCQTKWGMVCLGLQLPSPHRVNATIQFVTDGIPFTQYPYAMMAQQLDLDFTNAAPQTIHSVTGEHLRTPSDLEIQGTLTHAEKRHNGPIVSGLLIRNPFYDDLDRLRTATDGSERFDALTTYEQIPCYLSGHHPAGETHEYELKSLTLHQTDLTTGFSFINVECRGKTRFDRD